MITSTTTKQPQQPTLSRGRGDDTWRTQLDLSVRNNRNTYDYYDDDDDDDKVDDEYYYEKNNNNRQNNYRSEQKNEAWPEEEEEEEDNNEKIDKRYQSKQQQQQQSWKEDDNDDDDETDENDSNNNSNKKKKDSAANSNQQRRGGVYRVTFEDDMTQPPPSPQDLQLEWEILPDNGRYNDDYDDEDDDENEINGKSASASSSLSSLSATTYILLPPPHVQKPSAVIHFCGATWFGSSPHRWYNTLLQGLVRHTSCVVIATAIPITLWRNPLQHVPLANKVQRNLERAWKEVIVDEYYESIVVEQNVPVMIGMGHSLGARLLVILATIMSPPPPPSPPSPQEEEEEEYRVNNNNKHNHQRGRSKNKPSPSLLKPPPYQSLILMSFTNYGASVGIPGVQALWQQSKKLEQRQQQQRDKEQSSSSSYDDATTSTRSRRTTSRRDRDATAANRPSRRRRDQRSRRGEDYFSYDDEYDDDDDDDDLDWGDVWKDVVNVVGEQATRVQTMLTPRSDDLEVHPTPDQLWKALAKPERYRIPQTLLIQFDDDAIDQSSKLGHILATTTPTTNTAASPSAATAGTTTTNTNTTTASTTSTSTARDIKFCRLRGSHLTPIFGSSFSQWLLNPKSSSRSSSNNINAWPARATKALWKLLQGQPPVEADTTMTELRQSIVRYILDVVVVAAAAAEAAAAKNKQ